MISLIMSKIVLALIISFPIVLALYLRKINKFNNLKNSLDQKQNDYSRSILILEERYSNLVQAKDKRIENLEKELEESKSKNKVLQSGESLLLSIGKDYSKEKLRLR